MTDAGQLANHLVNHARSMGCELHEGERAIEIQDKSGHLMVVTDKASYETKAVIIATGMGLFKPKRIGCPGEKEFEGRGVYYKLPDRETLKDKKVMFVGGGNSALEMALLVCDQAETCLVHRRNTYRADEAIVEKVSDSNIEQILSSQVVEIKGTDHVTSVVLDINGKVEERPIDAIVINIGTASEALDMEGWGVELEEGLIKVDTDMCTSRRGSVRLRRCGGLQGQVQADRGGLRRGGHRLELSLQVHQGAVLGQVRPDASFYMIFHIHLCEARLSR